jgi:hypothetical protein
MSSTSPFSLTGNPRKQEQEQAYKKFVNVSLSEDYYMICIEKCINNYTVPLEGKEKVCLAKCIDRAYDYFMLVEKKLNPYDPSNKANVKTIFDTKNSILNPE